MDLIGNFYKKNYKLYLIVPAILLILFLALLPFVPKSIDLKGGTFLTIHLSSTDNFVSEKEMKQYLEQKYHLKDLTVKNVKSLTGNFIEIQYITPENLLDLKNKIINIKKLAKTDEEAAKAQALVILKDKATELQDKDFEVISKELDIYYNEYKNTNLDNMLIDLHNHFGITTNNVDIKEVGPTLGESFLKSSIKVAVWAAILVIVVIFLFFREFIPSVAVIASGIFDVLGAMAGMALFGIPLSLVTIPALLMLVGYSIDTDIMLTTKLLKRTDGSLRRRAGEAMKTGLTMTTTTLVALLTMLIISWLYNIQVIFAIASVLLCGLVVDIISTWLMNAPILLWYIEKKRS